MKKIIKVRNLKMTGIWGRESRDRLRNGLSALKGVKRVKIDAAGRISLKYDLMLVTLRDIDKAVTQIFPRATKGLMGRIWRAWIYYTENNVRDHMFAAATPCCSIPDEILNRKEL